MPDFLHINSITELHEWLGLAKPAHPLMSIIWQCPTQELDNGLDYSNVKLTSDLYLISMKGKTGGTFQYGRNSYDYQEGSLVFMSPDQVASFGEKVVETDDSGWSIFFHPDLIRKSELGKSIKTYSFFNYEVHEALHLSDKEKLFLIELVHKIELELNQNIDKHSQDLIIHNLETILKYSRRYYDRQFYTRTNINRDFVGQFERYLDDYFSSDLLTENGIPTVTMCGEALNMSGSYLSDLLKMETGKSAKAYIHGYLIDKAKTLLLNSTGSISTIAFSLGFEYPQHFSKLFKSKTGMSPSEYRTVN